MTLGATCCWRAKESSVAGKLFFIAWFIRIGISIVSKNFPKSCRIAAQYSLFQCASSANMFLISADSRAEEPLPAESYGCLTSASHSLTVLSILHIILYNIAVLHIVLQVPFGLPKQGLSDIRDWYARAVLVRVRLRLSFNSEIEKSGRFFKSVLVQMSTPLVSLGYLLTESLRSSGLDFVRSGFSMEISL